MWFRILGFTFRNSGSGFSDQPFWNSGSGLLDPPLEIVDPDPGEKWFRIRVPMIDYDFFIPIPEITNLEHYDLYYCVGK